MYIRGLIPLNFSELAEAVRIDFNSCNGVAMLQKLRTSKGDYRIKQCLSSSASLFKMGTSLKRKDFAPKGSELFPLRAVPYGMENHFFT